MLEFKGVTKQYLYGARVLGTLDMKIEDGEIISVLGGDGSGKTTFIKVASAVTDCEGEILLDGKNVETRTDDTIVVFDDLALFEDRSVYYNLAYPLKIRGFNKEETDKRIKEAVKKLNILAILYEKVKSLSLIDKKRVALTRIFLRDVKVIYVDDITSGLILSEERELFKEFSDIVLEKAASGVSVIYSTSLKDEAIAISNRIVSMHYGEIKQIGTYDELMNNPDSIWAVQSVDDEYNFEKASLKDDNGLKLCFKDAEIDAECLREKVNLSFIGKDIYCGWHSSSFDLSGERKEKVTKCIRDKNEFILYAGDKIIRAKESAQTVSTLPRINEVVLYDFYSECSIMK